MAYFPNGASGEVLDRQCAGCIVQGPCPVLHVQLEYNYDQIDVPKLRKAMNMLVDEEGTCLMKQQIDEGIADEKMWHADGSTKKVESVGFRHPCD